MTDSNDKSLLQLGHERLGPRLRNPVGLTEAEIFLLEQVENGGEAPFVPGTSPYDPEAPRGVLTDLNGIDTRMSSPFGPRRTLRAVVVRWLLTDREARQKIGHTGVAIVGALVKGDLDLSYAEMPFPVGFASCVFKNPIQTQHAEMKEFLLHGSATSGLIADRMKVNGNVFLDQGFHAVGEVRLPGAVIGGQLSCENATFENRGGDALFAERIKVAGDVFLRADFQATGAVRLHGADLGGHLICENAKFQNPEPGADGEGVRAGGIALDADQIKVAGHVYLRDGFHSTGEVRLLGAEIGGQLICKNAKFENLAGYALNADRITVASDVFLTRGVVIRGRASFTGAVVKGSFQWHGLGAPEDALLDLREASLRTLWIGIADRPARGALYLHGFALDSIFHDMPPDARWWIDLIERQTCETPESFALAKKAKDAEAARREAARKGMTHAAKGAAKDARKIEKAAEGKRLFLPQPYEQVANVLREQGHFEEAKEILIAREVRRRVRVRLSDAWRPPVGAEKGTKVGILGIAGRLMSLLTQKIWLYGIGRFVGYGHRPSIAGWFALAWVMATFGLVHLGWNQRLIVPSQSWGWGDSVGVVTVDGGETPVEIRFDPADLHPGYPEFQPFIFAVETFTPLIRMRQADYWQAVPSDGWGKALRWWLWITTLVGWGVTLLLSAAISGILKK